MDNVVAAGTHTTKSGETFLDMAKIGKSLASEITPEAAVYDIGPDGKELNIEFSNADMAKIMSVGRAANQIEDQQKNIATSMAGQNLSQYASPSMKEAQMGNQYSNIAGLRSSVFTDYESFESREYACLLPTEEEIQSGLYPKTKLVWSDDPEYGKEQLAPASKKEEIHTCVRFNHIDENGKVTTEYFGDPEAIESSKKEAAASDFKDEALMQWRRESMTDVYNLAQELRRYNSNLAEELLWFQHDSEEEEFDKFKAMCIKKLAEYRSKDPLADIKSRPVSTTDGRTHILTPNETTSEELDEYMSKLESLCHEETQAEKEQKVIEGYTESGDRLAGVRKEIDAIKNGKDCASAVKRLQMMTNICVCTSQEEYENEIRWQAQLDSNWNATQLNHKNQYTIWKELLKVCRDQVPEGMTYDQWFDLWWAKPTENFESIHTQRDMVSNRMVMRFKRIEDSQPTPEQRAKMVEDELIRRLNAFDHNMIDPNISLNDFLNGDYGANYIMHCCMEAELRRQRQSVLRLYDPEQLHDLFRYNDPNRSPILGPKPDYETLVSSEEYKRRRQLFVDAIYKKNSLGTLHGGSSLG